MITPTISHLRITAYKVYVLDIVLFIFPQFYHPCLRSKCKSRLLKFSTIENLIFSRGQMFSVCTILIACLALFNSIYTVEGKIVT